MERAPLHGWLWRVSAGIAYLVLILSVIYVSWMIVDTLSQGVAV